MNQESLVGVWELVDYVTRSESRVVYPVGERAFGQLIYSRGGWFSAQVYGRDRPFLDRVGGHTAVTGGDSREIIAAYYGSICYYGTWDLDVDSNTVYHNIIGAIYPGWEHSRRSRGVIVSGTHLTLLPPPLQVDGATLQTTIRWRRVG